MDLSGMTTEARNPRTKDLDCMGSLEIVTEMNREDADVPQAVAKALPQIAQLVNWVVEAFEAKGRLIYMGAGTSGRLGVLDASECPPTFGVSPDIVIGLIAGGEGAFVKAVEGAEDDNELGQQDLVRHQLTKDDVVVGIAASGRTPYVCGALSYANRVGCRTAAVSCNKNSEVGRVADLAIEIEVGPEVLTGSTRLKAGTAEKLVLNMITTASMVQIGKVYENLMVDVVQTNEKLRVRAENIVMAATGVSRLAAREAIEEAAGNVKLSIITILAGCTVREAQERLSATNGHVRIATTLK